MSEQPLSEHDLGLAKPDPRTSAIPALKELVQKHETTLNTPEQRVAWLRELQPAGISQFIIDINAAARGITDSHTFDGEGVQAGTMGGSIPPDQEDKEPILHYALSESQRLAEELLESGTSHQNVLDRIAVIFPTVVNKLHLFADGNGRTSRVFRMLLRDGTANAASGIDGIVSRDGFNKYDTTPSLPIESAIARKLQEQHGTQDIQIDDDIDAMFMEDYLEEIGKIPGIDPKTTRSWEDTTNFNEAARVFATKNSIGNSEEDGNVHIHLREFLTDLGAHPDKQREFLDEYREIRKEKVVLWVDGLTGKVDLPLPNYQGRRGWISSINKGREQKGQAPVGEEDTNTAIKLQTAYTESQSPARN